MKPREGPRASGHPKNKCLKSVLEIPGSQGLEMKTEMV